MGILMILLIVAAVLFVLALGMYLYVNTPGTCQEDSMTKKKFVFVENLCDVNKVSEFVSRVISQLMDSKEAHALLHQKQEGKGYVNSIAVLYFDSPRLIRTYKKCRVCAGLLCDKDTETKGIEENLKGLGYVMTILDYTRGISRQERNPAKGYAGYRASGIQMYPTIEKYLNKNSDLKEALQMNPSYEVGEIEFAEIVDPVNVKFYRPLYHAHKFQICTLPSLSEQPSKKTE